MNTRGFFQRSELRQTLWAFRREFALAALFSAITNLLMLAPTMYMKPVAVSDTMLCALWMLL